MKQAENKKIEISLSEATLPVFWVRSLRFSIFNSIDLVKDIEELRLSARIFLKLRDFGITEILFVFIYDIVKILKYQKSSFKHFDSLESIRFKDSAVSDSYKYNCINAFRSAKHYTRLRSLFSNKSDDVNQFAILFEQLFDGFSDVSSFYFFAPEYDLSEFDNDLDRIIIELRNNEKSISKTSEELGFFETLSECFDETVDFLESRFSKRSEIEQYIPDVDKLNEIKYANLFIKKSVRTQKHLIEEISEGLRTLDLDELFQLERSEDFVEADDAFYYPRGGINELTRKGSIETMLPSELVFIDESISGSEDSPDLFAMRYAENEILYFQRDDGYIKRKHYSVNIVLWDFLSFRTIQQSYEHTFDVYLESALHRFVKDFIKYTDGKGLQIKIFWNIKNEKSAFETPELFRNIFFDYEQLRIIENHCVANIDELMNHVKSNVKNESWFVILPKHTEHTQLQRIESKFNPHLIQFIDEDETDLADIIESRKSIHKFDIRKDTDSLKPFEIFINFLFETII